MTIQTFDTGAIRQSDAGKLDYEGVLSPLALRAFASYLEFHRHLEDGSVRASDNWQSGIPLDKYLKSAFRHFFDVWNEHRGNPTQEGIVWALAGTLFNIQGYLHEYLKAHPLALGDAINDAEFRRITHRPSPVRSAAPNIANAAEAPAYGKSTSGAVLPLVKKLQRAQRRAAKRQARPARKHGRLQRSTVRAKRLNRR